MNQLRVQVIDNFLPNPEAYRAMALAQPFYDIRGPDGEMYKHISMRPSDELVPELERALNKKVSIDYNMLRINYEGENPNNAVHTDNSYSDYAFILYLNTPEQCQGGTAFWRHKLYGWTELPTNAEMEMEGWNSQEVCAQLYREMNVLEAWEQVHLAEMKFNRMILFPTKQFHSRWPWAAWGTTKETGRMVAVGFFSAK